MNISNIKNKLTAKDTPKKMLSFLYWKISWLLLMIFLLLSSYCVFVWHNYVYRPHWDENRKQAYIKSKEEGVVLNKDVFNAIIEEKKARENDYQKNFSDYGDIFKLKTITVPSDTK